MEDRRLLSVGLGLGNPPIASHCQTLTDLPVTAQGAISAAIGRDQTEYHAVAGPAGFTFANPTNAFTAQLQSGVLHVASGADTWEMSLESFG